MKIDGDLRPLFRKHLKRVHWTSVETGGTGLGVPDSYGCRAGVMFWVEFKKTDGWAVTLSPEQVGWHMSHSRQGGRSFVAVRRRHTGGPRRGTPVDELWLLHGWAAADAKDNGLRGCSPEAVLGVWAGGPSRWDWDEVLAHLVAVDHSAALTASA